MQTLVNILVILDSIILGLGIYFVVTAKTVGESRAKKNSVKGKNPVKAASEFEVTPILKTKRKAKVQASKAISSKAQKRRR